MFFFFFFFFFFLIYFVSSFYFMTLVLCSWLFIVRTQFIVNEFQFFCA